MTAAARDQQQWSSAAHALLRLAAVGQARATMESNVELKHAMTAAARDQQQWKGAAHALLRLAAVGRKKDTMENYAALKHAMTAAARDGQAKWSSAAQKNKKNYI